MKKLVLAVIALSFSVGVNAACTRNDLTGTWVVYSSGAYSYATRCQLTFLKSGNTASASCLTANGVTANATLTVSTFDKDCHMVGTLVTPADTAVVDSYVSKGKDSMSGMWIETIGTNIDSGSFNGSKQ